MDVNEIMNNTFIRKYCRRFLGLLICYSSLVKSGYGKTRPLNAIMFMNILIPYIWVGTSNGFRPVPGLYGWLYKFIGLQKLLGNL